MSRVVDAADAEVVGENSEGRLFSLFATFPLCDFWQTVFSGEAQRVLIKPRHTLDSRVGKQLGAVLAVCAFFVSVSG